MAPKTPEHTTQTTEVKLPEWVDKAAQSNYELAQQIADKPYNPYTGQTVAGVSDLTNQAYGMLRGGAGQGTAGFTGAQDLYDQAGQGINGLDRSAYMNPFTKDVIDASVAKSQDALQKSLQANADKAIAAKAFGGTRGAIVDAATTAQSNKDLAELIAGLNSQNFNQATSSMQSDIASKISAAGGMSSNQTAANTSALQGVAGLLSAGQSDTAQQQRVLDDLKGKFDEKNNYDLERLNVLLSSLGMSPYGKTENTEKTTSPASSGTDFGQLGLGIFSILLGLSDRNEKTDIKRVGEDPKTGIPLYSYRYKGDPKTYPKVVGPMAQDIERMFPGSTVKVDGKMAVPLGVLAAIEGQ